MYFVNNEGEYYEGDRRGDDEEVPPRPTPNHKFISGSWVLPPPPVPHVVTRRQGRQALILAGKFAAVQAAIDAIEDETERLLAQSWWDDSAEYERTNPFLQLLAQAIRLDDGALDTLFVTGGGL